MRPSIRSRCFIYQSDFRSRTARPLAASWCLCARHTGLSRSLCQGRAPEDWFNRLMVTYTGVKVPCDLRPPYAAGLDPWGPHRPCRLPRSDLRLVQAEAADRREGTRWFEDPIDYLFVDFAGKYRMYCRQGERKRLQVGTDAWIPF